jgi:hypothetical protein
MEINEEKLKGILGEHKKDTDTKIDGIKGHFDTVLKEHKKDTDAKIDAVLKEQREEYQRHLDVVVEDFTSQIKIIAETLSGQQEQLVALREITKQNTEAIQDIQTQVVAIREMVAKNTEDIEIMKVDIAFIKNGLKKKVDAEEFETLENRVAILEAARSAA